MKILCNFVCKVMVVTALCCITMPAVADEDPRCEGTCGRTTNGLNFEYFCSDADAAGGTEDCVC